MLYIINFDELTPEPLPLLVTDPVRLSRCESVRRARLDAQPLRGPRMPGANLKGPLFAARAVTVRNLSETRFPTAPSACSSARSKVVPTVVARPRPSLAALQLDPLAAGGGGRDRGGRRAEVSVRGL